MKLRITFYAESSDAHPNILANPTADFESLTDARERAFKMLTSRTCGRTRSSSRLSTTARWTSVGCATAPPRRSSRTTAPRNQRPTVRLVADLRPSRDGQPRASSEASQRILRHGRVHPQDVAPRQWQQASFRGQEGVKKFKWSMVHRRGCRSKNLRRRIF
jgi:hypothetical protein